MTPTDTLVESLVKAVKVAPLTLLQLPFLLLQGRAEFKRAVAAKATITPSLLPYRESLLGYLQQEKADGRRIVLATAAHHSIAQGVFDHLGIFDDLLATEGAKNLKGASKLAAIRELVGNNFVYAGDSHADLPIWKGAKGAILVGTSKAVSRMVRDSVPVEREFPNEPIRLTDWTKALRVHQWLKNLLLFVPLLTAFSFRDINSLMSILLGFVAFSFAASATYVVNDLWDLESDRAHPRKRKRLFANAKIPILYGVAVAAVALVVSFILAMAVSKAFCLMLLLYLVLTSAYSWVLKVYVLIDVLILSILYTLRIVAGSVAIGVSTSSWLLAFSVFIFLSLALVKRCAELLGLESTGVAATRGRDYRVTDLDVLVSLGVGAALSAVVVFGLFISAPETQLRYGAPELLWLVAFSLIYWLARLWIKTSRGEMHDDPVVYAIKDRGSRIVVLAMVALMLLAYFIEAGDFQ